VIYIGRDRGLLIQLHWCIQGHIDRYTEDIFHHFIEWIQIILCPSSDTSSDFGCFLPVSVSRLHFHMPRLEPASFTAHFFWLAISFVRLHFAAFCSSSPLTTHLWASSHRQRHLHLVSLPNISLHKETGLQRAQRMPPTTDFPRENHL